MYVWFAYFNDVMGLVRWMETQHKKPPTIPTGLFGLGGGNALLDPVKVPPREPIAAEQVTAEDVENQKHLLGITRELCRKLEAEGALNRAFRLEGILKQQWLPSYETCHSEWKALREAIEDDIKDRYAQYMPREEVKLLFNLEEDWRIALSKFSVKEEIEAAANCLAVQQPTAAVFHLMRAMEVVVRRLGKRFNLPVTLPTVTWVVLTGNMTTKIGTWKDDTDARRKKRDAWSAAVSNLHRVGKTTRNPTMHPAKSYNPKQAREVYDATRIFMTEVAELLGASE